MNFPINCHLRELTKAKFKFKKKFNTTSRVTGLHFNFKWRPAETRNSDTIFYKEGLSGCDILKTKRFKAHISYGGDLWLAYTLYFEWNRYEFISTSIHK